MALNSADAALLRAFEGRLARYVKQAQDGPQRYARTHGMSAVLESSASATEPDESAQKALRPLFGKGKPLPPAIGDHPDFLHLRDTGDTCRCAITTLFMDIESSTRLSLLHDLETVRYIKNAFIQAAIQIIRCFDGHVHRIMGDAVMAFFGGLSESSADSRVNGLNCAAVLTHLAKNLVAPSLSRQGLGSDFGIRIGVDYGDEENVLWGAYGIRGADEVTATSFHVDIASKLQHAAGRNQVMLGEALVDAIQLPSAVLGVKKVVRSREEVAVPFVEPNHTNRDGHPINYRQHLLHVDEYLRCTPLYQQSRNITTSDPRPVQVFSEVYDEGRRTQEGIYCAASRVLPKSRSLKFRMILPSMPRLPYTVTCKVDNHGREAWEANPEDGDRHSTDIVVTTAQEHRDFCHWEGTLYHGLHYLTLEVKTNGRLEYRTRFGVFVE